MEIQIDPELCTAHRGLPCRICFDVCPIAGVLMLAKGKEAWVPVAGTQPCVGCGACQTYCPSEGAIRILSLATGFSVSVRLESDAATSG